MVWGARRLRLNTGRLFVLRFLSFRFHLIPSIARVGVSSSISDFIRGGKDVDERPCFPRLVQGRCILYIHIYRIFYGG